MRLKIAFLLVGIGVVMVALTDNRTVNAQARINVAWSVSVDALSERWVATATVGSENAPFTPHAQLEVAWPENFPSQHFCIDTFYMSSIFPQSTPVSYALIDHVEVHGGGPPLTVRRICYEGTKPDVYVEGQGDNSNVYHLTLAGDLLRR